jgi:formylglycine-generating enzyme required for sulfatase activity
MSSKVHYSLLFLGALLFTSFLAYAQLRPEVTPQKPPAAKATQIVIQTSPNAEVYLDDTFKGKASARGRLVIDNPKPGEHALRISLAGKKQYEHSVNVRAGQVARVNAALADIQKPEVPKPVVGPTTVVVETSPGAQVYLDDTFKGEASPQGRLVIENAKSGEHSLRVTLAAKKNYEQQVTVVAGQTANVQATLADLAGSIRVQTSPGAEVFLDNSSRGTADAGGNLALQEVAPGSHELRVSAHGKKEFRQSTMVLAGKEATIEARLESLGPPAGTARENPKDGLKYVWIPPGSFMMGCSPGDSECIDQEKPAHQVTITGGFWIGQAPVTVGAYKRFAAATGRQMPPAPDFNNGWMNENMPIVNVTWSDAQAYCGWMGGRLPTEAEWEYAARGGNTEARYGPIDEIAWYSYNSDGQTHDVAQKRPNGFGLYDTLGNVWQWVNDWYDDKYYQNSPSQDPPGPTNGQWRVLRGGSCFNGPRGVRVSGRHWVGPDDSYVNYGFRCGREAE